MKSIARILVLHFFLLLMLSCASESENTTNLNNNGSTSIVVEVGENRATVVNQQISLHSSASTIPQNLIVAYQWEVIGPSAANKNIVNAQSATAFFTPDTAGQYTIRLNVSHNQENYSDFFVLTVLQQPANGNGQLFGSVDSNLINRWGGNKVYVFTLGNTPDDRDGDAGDPIRIIDVVQSDAACDFNYQTSDLADGQYILAFTKQGNDDTAGVDDAIEFVGTVQVSIDSNAAATQHNFTANNIIQVGPGRAITNLMDADAVAQDGDVIEIDAVSYEDNIVVWRQNNITIRGVGGRPHLTLTGPIPFESGVDTRNGKGMFVIRGANIRVENIEFSNAAVTDENGAAIRIEGPDLTICNAYMHDGENGILGGGGHLLVEYSEFYHNGFGDGQTHNIYVDTAGEFTFRHSFSHGAKIGHNLKSRASTNYILYSRIMDEDAGTASYQIDLPNGGDAYVIGNIIQQGQNNDNSTIISFGAEGLKFASNTLYAAHNTIVNDDSGGRFFYMQGGSSGKAINNIYVGPAAPADTQGGNLVQENNLVDPSGTISLLEDRSGFDYHLTVDSPARETAVDPGEVNGVSLFPNYQYFYDAARLERVTNGILDRGAFEY